VNKLKKKKGKGVVDSSITKIFLSVIFIAFLLVHSFVGIPSSIRLPFLFSFCCFSDGKEIG